MGAGALFSDDRRGTAALLAASALLVLVALGRPALSGSEGRWAEAAREMILSGDWTRPTRNGELYYDKPLLSYWAIALPSAALGGVTEFTVRLPSALSAVLGVWATLRIGRKLRLGGIAAGWILLTSFGFILWAHRGYSDLMAASLMAAAVLVYVEKLRGIPESGADAARGNGEPSGAWWIAFWGVMALAAQAKGLTGFLIPGMAVLADAWLREPAHRPVSLGHVVGAFGAGARRLLSLWHIPGALVAVIIFLGPYFLSSEGDRSAGLQLIFKENATRYFKPFDNDNPVTVYLWALPVLAVPWSLYFFGAVPWSFRSWRTVASEKKLPAVAALLMLLFFALSGSRRDYYLLPIMPYTALWLAGYFQEEAAGRAASRTLAILLAAAPLLAAPALWFWGGEDLRGFARGHSGVLVFAAAVLVASGVGALWALRTGARPWVATGLAAACVWAGAWWVAAAQFETEDSEMKRFAVAVGERLGGASASGLGLYGTGEERLLFYVGSQKPLPVLKSADQAPRFKRIVSTNELMSRDILPRMGRSPSVRIEERKLLRSERSLKERGLVYAEFD